MDRIFLILILSFFLFSCANRSERFYFGNYSDAEKHYNKGEYEKAIEEYQSYIKENPEGQMAVISLYYIAKSHVALGQIQEAKSIYQDIITKYPDTVWANFSKTQLEELAKQAGNG